MDVMIYEFISGMVNFNGGGGGGIKPVFITRDRRCSLYVCVSGTNYV